MAVDHEEEGRTVRAHRPEGPHGGRRAGLAATLAVWLAACGTTQPRPTPPSGEVTRYEMDPVQITATQKNGTVSVDAYDAQELFDRATRAYSDKRFDEALDNYQRLLTSFAASAQARAAQYNLGLVHQDKGNWTAAASEFRKFIERHPDDPDLKDALFQLGISLAEAKDWPASEQTFLQLLDRKDLTADDRVESLTRRAIARYHLDDLDTAEYILRDVFLFKRRLEVTNEERLETDYFLALAQLMMAQISHKRSNLVALRWPEAQMKKDLEEKAKQLLEARRRYIEAVRYANPRIASMAAFQIGTLFQEFYDAVMAVPPPGELEGEEKGEVRSVYRDELRAKLRIVLEKALRGHEHNLELFERLGVETEWVTKSRDAIERLRQLLYPETPPMDVAGPKAGEGDVPAASPAAPNLDNPAPSRRGPGERSTPARKVL